MDSVKEMWALVCQKLKETVGDVIFNVWFSEIEIISFDGQSVELSAGEFKKKIIEQQFSDTLKDAFKAVLGFDIAVDLVSPMSATAKIEKAEQENDELNTFETFVVGSSNNLAFAAAKAVAENPVVKYNPLFIYGSSGLGKTHLLCAIKHAMEAKNPNINIIKIGCEDFVNLIVDGINRKDMSSIRDRFRNCDVLLMDDIQFIAGKPSTQEEFFHTFNALTEEHKQIVLTSDRPPKDIEVLEERMRSRFESGLITDIQPPDFETRMAIVSRKAEALGLELPGEVKEFISDKIKNNVRQLEGAVKKIYALVNLEGSAVNVSMVQNAIRDMSGNSIPAQVMVNKIIAETARTYGVTPADIISAKRDAKTSKARHTAIYAVRKATNLTQQEISEYFGNRDRTAILYSIKQMDEKAMQDSAYNRTVTNIIKDAQEQ